MRARMALLVAQIPFTAHEIDLKNKPNHLFTASPKGTVPVLVQPDGMVLEQSWDIVHWALTHPTAPQHAHVWWANAQTADNRRLLEQNDGDFKRHLDRYKYPERFDMSDPNAKAAFRETNRDLAVNTLLRPLEQQLTNADYLGGSHPCATDMGIFPFVRQFAAVEPAWFGSLPLPHVRAWLAGWVTSALFAHCMHKLTVNLPEVFPLAQTENSSTHPSP